jgi:hypothetical protein
MAVHKLQTALTDIQQWLAIWRFKANELKSTHITFTLKRSACPPVQLNGAFLPQADEVKYLGVHLDGRLTWRKHIESKRRHLDHQLRKLYWIIGRKSQLPVENKLLLYKAILKPIWSYGIQLWGTASTSNIEILERFQAKALKGHNCRTVVHPKCSVTPRPTCLYRQAHCEELQHHLPLPDSPSPQQNDSTADPRTLLLSAPQAKAPARPENYSLVFLQ